MVDGKEYAIPNHVSVGMPFSLRQPFKRLDEAKMINDFAALPVDIVVRKELSESLPVLKKQFKKMRTSLDVFGVLEVFRVSVNFPFTIPRLAIDYLSDKYTLIYSNLNASKIPYVFDGKKQLG